MKSSPNAVSVPTPAQDIAQLKRALVPLAATYHSTSLLDLPTEVLGVLADLAIAHGGDMAPAWLAWHDARTAAQTGGEE